MEWEKLDQKEIGTNIQSFRKATGITQADLAEQVGVSAQHISHIECGTSSTSTKLLVKISEALDVDLYDILGSNAPKRGKTMVNKEWVVLLANTTPEQNRICYNLCKQVLKDLREMSNQTM